MNMLSLKKAAFAIAFTAAVLGAKAQKVYTEGTITYTITYMGNSGDTKVFFKRDTSKLILEKGPAQIAMISTTQNDYFAVILDVPVASMKNYAISTPAELEEMSSNVPQYAFTKTADTKKIGDYNCVKYQSKDARDGKVYELWITNDIKVSGNILTHYYDSLGTPIMFTYLQGGDPKMAQTVMLKSISDAKLPANIFTIPAGYDKMTMTDMQAMGKQH